MDMTNPHQQAAITWQTFQPGTITIQEGDELGKEMWIPAVKQVFGETNKMLLRRQTTLAQSVPVEAEEVAEKIAHEIIEFLFDSASCAGSRVTTDSVGPRILPILTPIFTTHAATVVRLEKENKKLKYQFKKAKKLVESAYNIGEVRFGTSVLASQVRRKIESFLIPPTKPKSKL